MKIESVVLLVLSIILFFVVYFIFINNPIVTQAAGYLTGGASDGMIGGGPGFGMTGAMGGEFPKKQGPTSTPYPNKFKPTVKRVISKETRARKKALKKLQAVSMLSFDDFKKKNTKDENKENRKDRENKED